MFFPSNWLTLAAEFDAWLTEDAMLPIVVVTMPTLLILVVRQVAEGRRARALSRSEKALRALQPPAIADRLAEDPAYLSEPVVRDMPVLFVDLTGFTRHSERLGLEQTHELLKSFHDLIDAIVDAQGGLVINFMGDGAMITFGAVEIDPDGAARAVKTAELLVAATLAWLEDEWKETNEELDVRIGADYGPVILGRLGSDANQQITAAGDTVNVANRLLAVASEAGVRLALSARLLAAAGIADPSDSFGHRQTARIRGRSNGVVVWLGRHDVAGGAMAADPHGSTPGHEGGSRGDRS